MAGISLSGLASGLDTSSIISQLMALEQNKVTAVQMRQVKVQAHKDDLSSIKTKLDAFKSAATALSDAATWKASQTSASSDTTKLDVALLGGAGIGGHTIKIDKLASSAQHGFTYTPERHRRHVRPRLRAHGGEPDAHEGHDRRRGQRDRGRHRHGDQRQRELARRTRRSSRIRSTTSASSSRPARRARTPTSRWTRPAWAPAAR